MAKNKDFKTPRKGVLGYVSNVSKSIGYATFEKAKRMNPTIVSFDESNNQIFKTIYKDAINYKTTYKRGTIALKQSKFYEAADIGLKALKDDLKTGNLYNKKRVEEIERKATDAFLNSGDFDISLDGFDDFGDFGDFDDFDDTSTDSSSPSSSITEGDSFVSGTVAASSQANAEAISDTLIRTAEYSGNIAMKNTQLLYTQNIRAFGKIDSQFTALNENIGSIMKYMDENISPRLADTSRYFDETTKLLQDQTALLRQIAENTAPKIQEEEKKKSSKINFDDLIGAGGAVNFDQYAKAIQKNFKNYMNEKTMGMGGLLNSFGDDTNILATFAANPYGLMMDALLDKFTPKRLEQSLDKINKTLAGAFGSFITKMNGMAQNDEGSFFSQFIGKVFGIQSKRKTGIDTSMYQKGKVDWNGKSEKALTEIIPNKLEKIISLMSGEQEKTYDYEKGQYISINDLQREYDRFADSFYKRASSDILGQMSEMIDQNIKFRDKYDRDRLYKDLDSMFKNLYDNNKLLDVNNKKLSEKYYDYGVSSEQNMALIQAIAQSLPKYMWHEFNTEMQNQYNNQRKEYERYEKDGKFNQLFNNSRYNEFASEVYDKNGKLVKNKKGVKTSFNTNILLDSKDNTGHNIFYYLQNMYKNLDFIRRFGLGGNNGIGGSDIDDLYREISDQLIPLTDSAREETNRRLREYERQNNQNQRFLNNQDRIMRNNQKEGRSMVDFSRDITADQVKNQINYNQSVDKNRQRIKDANDSNNLFNRIRAVKELSDKSSDIVDKIENISKKPIDLIEKTIDKADQHIFELIYGKEGKGDERKVKGFMDAMIAKLNITFNKFNNFLDEKILNPLKEKLGIDEEDSLIKGISKKLGLDEKKQNVKDWFSDITQGVRDNLKASFSTIGETITEELSNIFDPMLERASQSNLFRNRNQVTPLTQEEIEALIEENRRRNEREENTEEFNPTNFIDTLNNNRNRRRQISPQELLQRRRLNQPIPTTEEVVEQQQPPVVRRRQQNRIDVRNPMDLIYRRNNMDVPSFTMSNENFEQYLRNESERRRLSDPVNRLRDRMQERVPTYVQNISDKVDTITGLLERLLGANRSSTNNQNRPGPFRPNFPNVTSPDERNVIQNNVNTLTQNINDVVRNHFNDIPGHAAGGVMKNSHLAVVGKGETIIPKDKYRQLSDIVGERIERLANSKQGIVGRKNLNGQARKLYERLVYEMGGENIDPNIVFNMLKENNRAGEAFANLKTREESEKILEMLQRVQYGLSQRNEGKVDDYGNYSEQAQEEGVQDVFSDTFNIYKRGIQKTLSIITGNDMDQEKKKTYGAAGKIFKDARIYGADVITGGLLGAGVSILTGLMSAPIIGAGIALARKSETLQNILLGEQEVDKDGNVSRKGGLVPEKLINTVSKVAPDLKKFGVMGLVATLLPGTKLGFNTAMLLAGSLAFIKNTNLVQTEILGDKGMFSPQKMKEFKENKLPKMLAGVGVLEGARLLGFHKLSFGLVPDLIIGSALGFAASTNTFQRALFGEYDESTKTYKGGAINYLKDRVVTPLTNFTKDRISNLTDWIRRDILIPLKDSIVPLGKQLALIGKHTFGNIGKALLSKFNETLGLTIKEALKKSIVGKALSGAGSLVKGAGRNLGRGIGYVLSSPARGIGALGRVAKRHQVRIGEADYLTAEERLNYMRDQDRSDFFYKEGKKQINQTRSELSNQMSKRFGKADMLKVRAMMDLGEFKKAEKYIIDKFQYAQDQESIDIRDSMLNNLSRFKQLNGDRISPLNTYQDKKEIGKTVEDDYRKTWNKYNSSRKEEDQLSFDSYMEMVTNGNYKKNKYRNYNLNKVDELIAGSSNEQLNQLNNYWNATKTSERQYNKMKNDSYKQINKLLKDKGLNLSARQISTVADSLTSGHYESALSFLDREMNKNGLASEHYDKYDEIKRILSDFKVTDKLRVDRNASEQELDKLLKQMFPSAKFGKDIDVNDFFNRTKQEIKLRNRRGINIINDAVKENDPQTNIQIITDRIMDLVNQTKAEKETADRILEILKQRRASEDEKTNRQLEKDKLDNKFDRHEQKLSMSQRKRKELIERLGYEWKTCPVQLRFMPLNQLEKLANDQVKSDITNTGFKDTPDFIKNMTEEKAEEYRRKSEELKKRMQQQRRTSEGLGEEDKEVISTLDEEGNEVRMKKDNKTGQYEADVSDESTKRSIAIHKENREKQNMFYDKFLSLFKKDEKGEGEPEKKKNNWLAKLLGILGLGKTLLGGVKKLFGGFMGRGLLGGLLGRGILGTVGKGALVLGGLMYLPQILDLFQTKIAPALNESWKNYIQPWIEKDAVPMLKQGLITLVQNLPGMLTSTIKFITTELIPSLLKGFGMSTDDAKGNLENAALKSVNKKASKIAAENATETAAKTGSKVVRETAEETVENGAKTATRGGKVFNVAKKGFGLLGKGLAWGVDKTTNLIPGAKVVKGVGKLGIKGFKKVTDLGAKAVSGLYKTGPELLDIANNGGFITKIMKTVGEKLEKLLSNSVVKNLLGKTKAGQNIAEKLGKEFVPKLLEAAEKRIVKKSPALVARLAGLGTGGILTIGFAVADFTSGWNNASTILGITDEATKSQKIIAGLVKAVSGLTIVGSLIPTSLIIDLIIPFLKQMGVDTGELDAQRDKAKEEVEEYNKKNNTDYTLEEYNDEVNDNTKDNSILKKIKNFFTPKGVKEEKENNKKNKKDKKNNKKKKKEDKKAVNPLIYGDGANSFGKGEDDTANGNPYYSQKNISGGLHNLMSDAGCGPTAAAMALQKVTGQKVSPESLAKDGLKSGDWDSEGARGSLFSDSANKYGVKTSESGSSFEKFDQMVSAGVPTVVSGTVGKGGNSPYTKAGHLVTVFGKDKNGNYLVNDPRGKKYSKAYTKEQLMNGFNNSWSFGKGEDDGSGDLEQQTMSVANAIKMVSTATRMVSNPLSAISTISKSITGNKLIDTACAVLQNIFIKVFKNSDVVDLLGNVNDSDYSAASSILSSIVPKVTTALQNNGDKNQDILRAVIKAGNLNYLNNYPILFMNGFNDPANTLGKADIYSTGMRASAGLLNMINNHLVFNKILTPQFWNDIISKELLPLFGESNQQLKEIQDQTEKALKSITVNNASNGSEQSLLTQLVSSGMEQGVKLANKSTSNGSKSLLDRLKSAGSNVVKSGLSMAKRAANSVGNFVNKAKDKIGGMFSGALNTIGGLLGFGKGEGRPAHIGKGKETKDDPKETIGDSVDATPLGKNNFPYFSQYGDYRDEKELKKPKLSEVGCGPTSAAMVLSKIKDKFISPESIVNKATPQDYDSDGSTETLFPNIGKQYGVNVKEVKDFNKVRQYASQGVPMVISGQGGNLYGNDQHIVAGFGKTKNGYIINDPSSYKNSKVYNEHDLQQGFQGAWIFGDKGYKNDLKDAEQIISPEDDITLTNSTNMMGKGKDPTTMTMKNGFPYWSQVAFGGDILETGCGPTSAAMMLSYIKNKEISPKSTCAKANGHGYSYSSGGNGSTQMFEYLAKQYDAGSVKKITSISELNKRLKAGYPTIIDGHRPDLAGMAWADRCMKSMYSPAGHYSVAVGMDGKDYVVNDPRGSRFSGRRPASHVTKGFGFAVAMGDKKFDLDKSKISELGISGGEDSNYSSDDTGTDGSSSGEAQEASAPSFFGDMATAIANFSKTLFGFPIEDTSSGSSDSTGGDSDSSDSNSNQEDTSGADFEPGKTYNARFTAYYPFNSAMEGGYYDKKGNKLDPSKRTCAAPAEIPYGTKIKVTDTGTDCDNQIYTVNDTGGAIVKKGDTYRIDILKRTNAECNTFGKRSGKITFQKSVGKGEGRKLDARTTAKMIKSLVKEKINSTLEKANQNIENNIDPRQLKKSNINLKLPNNIPPTILRQIKAELKQQMAELPEEDRMNIIDNVIIPQGVKGSSSFINNIIPEKERNILNGAVNSDNQNGLTDEQSIDENGNILYGTGSKKKDKKKGNKGGKIKLWEKVVGYARAFKGKMRYSYGSGALNNNGLTSDCSHFTAHVLNRAAGLNLSPASADQRHAGKKVTKPQAGDLVVWNGHVGLVSDSNTNMIDCGSGVVAKERSYEDPHYWRSRTDKVFRRVLSNPNQLVDPQVKNYNKKIGFSGTVSSQGGQNLSGGGADGSGGSTATFPKYALNETQKKGIARIISREQSGKAGRFAEASLLANLTDISGDNKATVDNIVAKARGKWFSTRGEYSKSYAPPQDALDAVQACIIDGKRTLPRYINEHDCFSDLTSVTNDGKAITKTDRSKYKQHVTKIKNRYGASGTFYSFPDSASDPFYYTSASYRTKWGEGHFDTDGNGSAGNADGGSGGSSSGGESSAPEFFSDMATAVGNFSKTLFGFPLEETSSGSSDSTGGDSDSSDGNADIKDGAKGNSGAEKLFNFYKNNGFSDAAAAGMVGNSDCETGGSFDPTIKNSIGATGLFQFLSTRLTNLKNYAKEKGKSWKDFEIQAAFPIQEMSDTKYKDSTTINLLNKNVGGFKGFKALTDPYKAGYQFGKCYERGGYNEKRGETAKKWYDKLVKTGKGEDIDNYFESTLNGTKTQDFGFDDNSNEFHTGVDFAADEGNYIRTPVEGRVVESTNDKKYGFGNTMVIKDKNDKLHRFAHMKDLSKYGKGDKVDRHSIIGQVGSTGRSTGPHLHYEVEDKKGVSINPNTAKKIDKTKVNREGKGGTLNKVEDAVLTFKDSNQKVNVGTPANGAATTDQMLKLINVIIGILGKVATNTAQVSQIVELLTTIANGGAQAKAATSEDVNKYSSSSRASKTSELFDVLQSQLTSTDRDNTNLNAILDTLETLAKE